MAGDPDGMCIHIETQQRLLGRAKISESIFFFLDVFLLTKLRQR